MLPTPLGLVNRISHSSCPFQSRVLRSDDLASLSCIFSRAAGLPEGNTCHAPALDVLVQCAYRSASWQCLHGRASLALTEDPHHLRADASQTNVESCEVR